MSNWLSKLREIQHVMGAQSNHAQHCPTVFPRISLLYAAKSSDMIPLFPTLVLTLPRATFLFIARRLQFVHVHILRPRASQSKSFPAHLNDVCNTELHTKYRISQLQAGHWKTKSLQTIIYTVSAVIVVSIWGVTSHCCWRYTESRCAYAPGHCKDPFCNMCHLCIRIYTMVLCKPLKASWHILATRARPLGRCKTAHLGESNSLRDEQSAIDRSGFIFSISTRKSRRRQWLHVAIKSNLRYRQRIASALPVPFVSFWPPNLEPKPPSVFCPSGSRRLVVPRRPNHHR